MPTGYAGRPPGGGGHDSVPASRCVSAADIRFLGHPVPAEELGPPCGRLTERDFPPGPRRGTAFRAHELRPGWVPSLPRGQRCSSRPSRRLARRVPLHPRPVLPSPPPTIHQRGSLSRGITRVRAIHPSGLPLACGRPDGTDSTWAFPRASHPADQEPTARARVVTGHRARTWIYTLNITSADRPISSSLTTCDLTLHDETGQRALDQRRRLRLARRRRHRPTPRYPFSSEGVTN